MTSGGRRREDVRARAVPVGDEDDDPGGVACERRRGRRPRRLGVTNGRSIGRTRTASAPPATTSARASAQARVEAPRCAGGGSAPRARPRGARTSRSGLTTSTSPSRSTARAATTVRASSPSTRSCRSSASSDSPSRDLAPASEPTGMIAAIRVMPGRANSRTARASRARPAASAMIVSVTRVRTPRAAIVGLEAGVDGVEDERRGDVAGVIRGHSPGARFVTERDQHPVGRALQRDAADDRLTATTGTPAPARASISAVMIGHRPGSARSTRSGSTAR